METNHTPLDTRFLSNVFDTLTRELDAALDAVVSHDADRRVLEILDHCFKASILAKTGQLMVERAGG